VNGSDSNAGSCASPWKTITHAMSVATSGQIVLARPGTYDEANGETIPMPITPGVTLLGDESTKGISTCGTVLVQGTIAGDAGTNPPVKGIVEPGASSTIAGVKVACASCVGGWVELVYTTASGVTIRNNTFAGSAVHTILHVPSATNIAILGNVISGGGTGIYFNGASGVVAGNVIRNNGYGVEYDNAGGDMGGGPQGSDGGNVLACNTNNDVFLSTATTFYGANNQWDQCPPSMTGVLFGAADIDNVSDASTVVTTGCTPAADACN
jgi:hypothetical protein